MSNRVPPAYALFPYYEFITPGEDFSSNDISNIASSLVGSAMRSRPPRLEVWHAICKTRARRESSIIHTEVGIEHSRFFDNITRSTSINKCVGRAGALRLRAGNRNARYAEPVCAFSFAYYMTVKYAVACVK